MSFAQKLFSYKDVFTLIGGTTLSQAIPIIAAPILTRLYAPEDFGLVSLIAAIAATLGSMATARYELAVLLPKKQSDAINLCALGIIITLLVTLLTFISVLTFRTNFNVSMKIDSESHFLFFVPIIVLFIGIYNSLHYLVLRNKKFSLIARTEVLKSVLLVSVQMLLGLMSKGAMGLINGQVAMQGFSVFSYYWSMRKSINWNIRFHKIIALAKKFRKFPIYSLPGILLNNLTNYLMNFFLPYAFSLASLGYFAFAQKILGIPSTLIGAAVFNVFMKECCDEKEKIGTITQTFNKFIFILMGISIFVYGALLFIVVDIFRIVFGENWVVAGEFAQILIPFFAIRFVVSSISGIDTVLEKQNYYLIFNAVLFLTNIPLILFLKEYEIKDFLVMYSATMSLVYFIYGIILWNISRRYKSFHSLVQSNKNC